MTRQDEVSERLDDDGCKLSSIFRATNAVAARQTSIWGNDAGSGENLGTLTVFTFGLRTAVPDPPLEQHQPRSRRILGKQHGGL